MNQSGQQMTTNQALQNSQNAANRNNMSFYNGEWWYRGANDSLMYYRNNAWVPYQAGQYTPYTAAYRGTNSNMPNGTGVNGRTFTDENGMSYRRDYAPASNTFGRGATTAQSNGQLNNNTPTSNDVNASENHWQPRWDPIGASVNHQFESDTFVDNFSPIN